MAAFPEREQADTSFDTLYHLAKKLEVHDISRAMQQKLDLQPTILIGVTRSILPQWDVHGYC